MIQSKDFYITKEVGGDHIARGRVFFVKTASTRDGVTKVVWTKTTYKAKRFNGTHNIRKFVRDYKIQDAYVTSITAGIMIEQIELENTK